MCRRKTAAMQAIEAMCASQDMDITETCEKTKMLLKVYRRICWTSLGRLQLENDEGYCICDKDIEIALDYLYSYTPIVEKKEFEKKLKTLFDSRWMVELIDNTMLQVHEFPVDGNLYFEILQKMYLGRYKYTESDLLEIMKIERSRFYERKKEAIIVFGLALWGTVLPKISLMIEDNSQAQ